MLFSYVSQKDNLWKEALKSFRIEVTSKRSPSDMSLKVYFSDFFTKIFLSNIVTSNNLLSSGFVPIGHITFVFSAFIVVNWDLRIKFYNHFDGYVPLITQCILNHIRSGLISDEFYIVDLKLDKEKYYYLNILDLSRKHFTMKSFS